MVIRQAFRYDLHNDGNLVSVGEHIIRQDHGIGCFSVDQHGLHTAFVVGLVIHRDVQVLAA